MTDDEKFEAALKWVEEELGGLVNVNRLDSTNAELDTYHVGLATDKYAERWAVWEMRDEDFSLLQDEMGPIEAVAYAVGFAVPDILQASFPDDAE